MGARHEQWWGRGLGRGVALTLAGAAVVAVAVSCSSGGEGGGGGDAVVRVSATPEAVVEAVERSLAEPRRLELALTVAGGEPVTVLRGSSDGERTETTADAGAVARAVADQAPDEVTQGADGATLDVVTDGTSHFLRSSAFADVLEPPSAREGEQAVSWDAPAVGPLVELEDRWGRVDIERFLHASPEDLPAGQVVADPHALLDAVATATSVDELGQGEVDGEPVAGLAVEVRLATMNASGADLLMPGAVADWLLYAGAELVVPVEVWIDGRGHVRRLHYGPDVGALAESVGVNWASQRPADRLALAYTLDLGDYGADDVEVAVPDGAVDVTEAYGAATGQRATRAGPAADGADVAACVDGSCDIEVTVPVTLTLDGAHGVSELVLESAGPQGLVMHGNNGPGSTFEGQSSPGGTLVFNGLRVETVSIEGSVVRVYLSTCSDPSSCAPGRPEATPGPA
jgi:hypothetical protein